MSSPNLGFTIEWFDPVSSIMQSMYLKFFIDDNTLEILTDKSCFLKRIYYPEVAISDLFLGNTITIHKRLYTLAGYANKFTQEYMQAREVHFVAVVSSTAMRLVPRVMVAAKKHKLSLGHVFTTSTSVYSDSVVANDGDTIVELVGTVSTKGHYDAFLNEVSRMGTTDTMNVGQMTFDGVKNLLRDCRGARVGYPCSLCLIKPHIIREGKAGEVIQTIFDNDFQISGLLSIHLTIEMAEELFNSYRGIIADYSLMLETITSGPSLAVAVTSRSSTANPRAGSFYDSKFDDSEDVVTKFRDVAGPYNPQLAKILRPKSIRALFGMNELTNAVHCTDLPEDGEMECRFFFQTLANL